MSADSAILERIAAVDPVHADTMRRQPTSFTSEQLPFYRRFQLVKADVDLPHRPLEFRYADDGSAMVYLSGAAEDVYQVNDREGLKLAEREVAPYVRFFFANTGRGERELVEQPSEVTWLPATESDPQLSAARAEASTKIRPLDVSPTAGGYRVAATAVEGTRLLELLTRVSANGRVTVESTKVLADNLPVPERL